MTTRNMADKCNEAIAKQLKKRNIKRNADVRELYLGENELTEVSDLERFRNLYCLWLNSNRLRTINCLSHNYRLAELYLQNNEITTITGSLRHLTSLQVLFLHNNQLQKLEVVVKELENMQKLQTLNLFYNPVAQEPEYRQYVIYKIPSIELLDRQEVLTSERDLSERMYNQMDAEIKDTIAFGRRSEGRPSLYYHGSQVPLSPTVPVDFEVGNNFYRNNPPYATEEQAITTRALRRSLMEYTSFDWSKVPSSLERRTGDKPFENPQVITTRFR